MNGTAPGLRGKFKFARKEADFDHRARFEYALKAATVEKKAAGVRQIELGETSGLTRKPAPSCLAHEGLDC